MKISNILAAEDEAAKFLRLIQDVKKSDANQKKFNAISTSETTYTSKETAALKRSSMDLTRSLSKMRNNIY